MEDENVLFLGASSKFNVEQALAYSTQAEDILETVLVLGFRKDGELYSVGSSMTKKDALWLIKCAENFVMGLTHHVE